ncbi:hypothetical protein [Xanthomonas arboricola]|uniref:hypothetical protein n=1 Tax=Xanthomonas arboricola TaxID=56448 RepID=UPI001431E279|nr:hypothetical protein [Xanthomonas arboricola]NJB80308.1 hypothetical protein [Xanthomonas arboricola]
MKDVERLAQEILGKHIGGIAASEDAAGRLTVREDHALAAVKEALLVNSAAVDIEQFREAVMVYQDHLRRVWKHSHSQGHPQAIEGDRLLSIINEASRS